MKFKQSLLLFVIALMPVSASAQKAELDTTRILVGDTVGLTFSISPDAGSSILFPEFDSQIIEGIEIAKRLPIDTAEDGTYFRRLIIRSFEDSIFNIKPFYFVVDDDSIKTNPLILRVNYYQPDSAFISQIDTTQAIPLRDNKAQHETPWTFLEFWKLYGNYVLLSLLAVLILLLILRLILRRRKNKPVFVKPKPKIPPHITAIDKLHKLKEKKLWQQDKYKLYYTELTDILRLYIQDRYKIPAPEYTANQIIAAVNRSDIPEEAKQNINQIFPLADLVKFAKMKPLANENDRALKQALEFIERTKQEEEKEPAEDEQKSEQKNPE